MAVSWTEGTRTAGITGTGNTYQDVVTAIGNTTYAETVFTDGITRVYNFDDVIFDLAAGATLEDYGCIILHRRDAGGAAIKFGSSTSAVLLGYLDDTDPDKPRTVLSSTTEANIRSQCVYSFLSASGEQTFCEAGDGIFAMYGGVLKIRDDEASGKSEAAGENETFKVTFPNEVRLIGTNVENIGGAVFSGTSYRLQECAFKSSKNAGFDFVSESTKILRNIKIMRCDVALDLNSGGANVVLEQVKLRGNTVDLRVNGLAGTVSLLDSDTISGTHATMSFDTGGAVVEGNSYTVELIDTAGDGVDDVRAAVYRKSDGTVYGAEQVSSGGGSETPSSFTNPFIVRRTLYDSTYDSYESRLDYGNFGIRVRQFGYKFLDIEKVPGEAALEDLFIVADNSFITETTEATVAAYTGFGIDEVNEEIDITSSHNMAELYDWLQWKQYQAGLMDTPQLMQTKDGVSFTMPAAWEIPSSSLANLDLTGKYVINRYVPSVIQDVVSGAQCAVVNAATETTLAQAVASDTEVAISVPYTAATNVYIRARRAGYKSWETLVTLGSTGNTVTASMPVDEEYSL